MATDEGRWPWAKLSTGHWSIACLLSVHLLAFGLLIPELGYYLDDWETVFIARLMDHRQYWIYFQGSRPLAAWSYILVAPLAGGNPLIWHVLTFGLSLGTAVAFYALLVEVWPRSKRQALLTAALFSVYPFFRQHPIAVQYHQHWLAYVLYFLSVYSMMRAARSERRTQWITLSLSTQALHLGLLEYFAGVELLRPFFLYVSTLGSDDRVRKRVRRVFGVWLPNLILLMGFVTWRMVFVTPAPGSSDRLLLLYDFFGSTIPTALLALRFAVQDFIGVMVVAWFDTLRPELLDFDVPSEAVSWLIAGAAAAVTGLAVLGLSRSPDAADGADSPDQDPPLFLRLGLLAFLFGMAPIWLTGRQSIWGLFSDRFALPALFGAAMIWVGLLSKFGKGWRATAVMVVFLVGLASGLHFRVANEYRWSAIKQNRFSWQLFWRAPSLSDGTLILTDGDVFPFVRPTFSINLLYGQSNSDAALPYKHYLLGRELIIGAEGPQASKLMEEFRGFTFRADPRDSLVVFYDPPAVNCLWVLQARDVDDPFLSPLLVQAARYSNLDRIEHHPPTTASNPPADVFGVEPPHDWCYYYQKASLAEQSEDWHTIGQLAEEVFASGYWPTNTGPSSPHEWLPYIHGLASLGRIDEAVELTLASFQVNRDYRTMLCQLWSSMPGMRSEHAMTVASLDSALACQD